jgi:hypothetical protein
MMKPADFRELNRLFQEGGRDGNSRSNGFNNADFARLAAAMTFAVAAELLTLR